VRQELLLKKSVLTTTRHNLASHYQSIPLADMPPGIQDAVKVCRGLGIYYLWVDSLYIVQDDHVDWRDEWIAFISTPT
jgi:hypothetical protein